MKRKLTVLTFFIAAALAGQSQAWAQATPTPTPRPATTPALPALPGVTPAPTTGAGQPGPATKPSGAPTFPPAPTFPTGPASAAARPAPRAGGFPLELALPMLASGAAALGGGVYLLRRKK